MRTVYLISGPAGAGKSTTSERLVGQLTRSAYISGDDVSHIPVNGREQPWLSEETNRLTWTNIASLCRNLVNYRFDVVVDYVAFPQDAAWLAKALADLDIRLKYVVLWVEPQTLLARDAMRDEDVQMKERCLILREEFLASGLEARYMLDTTDRKVEDLASVLEEIVTDSRFDWV